MTATNDGLKVPSRTLEEAEIPNFMGLPDGEVNAISQVAVANALTQKQAMGLPITIWNDGNPYRQYADGRIEYIKI